MACAPSRAVVARAVVACCIVAVACAVNRSACACTILAPSVRWASVGWGVIACSASLLSRVAVPRVVFHPHHPPGVPQARWERAGKRADRYPTEPSISIWIRRFNSTAYSIGSSRVNGSIKPSTIIDSASASLRPRDCR